MGEHKRPKPSSEEVHKLATAITEQATDEGKVVALGAAAFVKMVVPPDASPGQRNDMRTAFIAGADFLFASIMAVMDAGTEPTAKDLARMELIHAELDAFRKEFTTRFKAPERPQ